ncbi:hypothetical protein VOLCADRAFT_94931 [Volvox carteri f. nagariensis]|uniref:Uncharacterized protein MTP2 n=1 Tax=Volvox carteri f. nagariensis TaxID=3068 RepID=D8U657_VOLCA|nr:uncharacterized protein VOLCADRAFT_94931 [Volvox carteri f. nagariensis]EFJ44883.1 hypothetical protein VOLCADRAFT_94931 [Volvox carteri f. nagariensis]|eukprot:XP_002954166.1 hypothetical protein VOLCADRAFT_94931 [Volvox carteri f. nagariensis]
MAYRDAVVPSQQLRPNKEADAFSRRVRLGINASWLINVLLLVSKAVVFGLSGSYAVLASAVDSLVDILSQAVLAVAEYQAARFDQRFPIGRTRMAELSVLACAGIMFVSTALVIRESAGSIWEGLHGHVFPLNVDAVLIGTLSAATALKLGLYIYCQALRKNPIMARQKPWDMRCSALLCPVQNGNPPRGGTVPLQMLMLLLPPLVIFRAVALSEDHLNDVMSNVAAIAGAAVAGNLPRFWFVDPAVAVLFSLLIIRNWLAICWEQGQKMIGLEAPEELTEEVTHVTQNHCTELQLDRVTAYHHGSHMVVEVEVLLPADMTVRESHDIALALQHKIEAIDNVERAFVHVDYERRSLEEHKVERNLKLGVKDVMKPLAGLDAASGPSSPGGPPAGSALPTAALLPRASCGVGNNTAAAANAAAAAAAGPAGAAAAAAASAPDAAGDLGVLLQGGQEKVPSRDSD